MLGLNYTTPLNLIIPTRPARAIAKAFGIETAEGLLENYPRKYLRYGNGSALEGALPDDRITFIGTVVSTRKITGKRPIFKVEVTDGHDTIDATFFSARYAPKVLHGGVRAMFTGKLSYFNGKPQLQHPDFLILDPPKFKDGDGAKPAPKGGATGSMKQLSVFGDPDEILAGREWLPVYRATKNLSTWTVMGAVNAVLNTLPPVEEPLGFTPEGFLSLDEAIRQVHNPGPAGPDPARERLKYNEALRVALIMALRRADSSHRTAPALPRVDSGFQDQLLGNLPFAFTAGQEQVLREVSGDLESTTPMSRLLQGEVGSGKTIVALAAMLQAVDNGLQCALLAPTEVLTLQHEKSLRKILMRTGVHARVVALTGSMSTVQRQEALLAIMSGEADIVVGTHAIIQDTVEFYKLGFVVVDEQHRFGVEQRDALRGKTGSDDITPHMLVMTATPIPRTIAMTVFGDLAVSTLKELPGGRRPIQSSMVPEAYPAWVARSLARIREEVAAGHQAYVVCPRIDGEGGVLEITEMLSDGPFRDLRVACLHGRMRGEDKDAVMSSFAAGEIDVLVSTTVIEVGVDVPNATVMLVRESECFGMSQLHQLRGRVGRGGHQSLCLFHTLADPGTPSFERVSEVAATSDGFELAELDLRHRQEGDVLGTNQSGTLRTLKLLNLSQDLAVIERANGDAALLVDKNPERAQELVADIEERSLEYLDKS